MNLSSGGGGGNRTRFATDQKHGESDSETPQNLSCQPDAEAEPDELATATGDPATDRATGPESTDSVTTLPGVEEDAEQLEQEPALPAIEGDSADLQQEASRVVSDAPAPREPVASTAPPDPTSELAALTANVRDTGPVIDPEASRKLARIFAAMRPADAAAVLQGMLDPEVQAILLGMADRQAAAILGDFETGRAASLSQLVLMTQPSGS